MAADHALGTAYKMNVIFISESKQSHSSSHETEEIMNFLVYFHLFDFKAPKEMCHEVHFEKCFYLMISIFFHFLSNILQYSD